MSFRTRLALSVAGAVAIVVVGASPLVYALVRSQLRGEVDDALRHRAASIQRADLKIGEGRFREGLFLFAHRSPALGDGASYVQVYEQATRRAYRPEFQDVALPVDERVRDVAARKEKPYFTDTTVAGSHVRMRIEPIGEGYALQVMRPLGEVDSVLGRIKTILLVLAGLGILVAAALGFLVARGALRPVRRLTETAEHVSQTKDLTSRIEVSGRDELSRLAATFNTMLAALEESDRAQKQLVTDASHELRTPLTSLRTNMELLLRHEHMEDDRRRQLTANVVEQLDELTALVAELVELARGEQQPAEPEDVRLDLVVSDVVARAQRDHPDIRYAVSSEASMVHGVRPRIERAVSNLLDNAAKWSAPGGVVDVVTRDGEVSVRDRGPGIADEDLPFVFDRFYRAPNARRMPGSGLGLAIVKQVADSHGGEVLIERPADGGTTMRLRLPALDAGEGEPDDRAPVGDAALPAPPTG